MIEKVWVRRLILIATTPIWYPFYWLGSKLGMPIDMGEINWTIREEWRR